MLTCFKCQQIFADVDIFISHLKCHNFINTPYFECPLCSQCFQSIHSFKRHLKKKEKFKSNPECDINLNYMIAESTAVAQVPSSTFPEIPNESFHSTFTENEPKHVNQNICLEDITSHIFAFGLKLYGNISLTRKAANEIISDVDINIVTPILDFITQELITISKNEYDVSNLNSFLIGIKTTLQSIKSEHKIKNVLLKKNMYCEPKTFIIDNSMNIDNIGKHQTTGVLLPLKNNLIQYLKLPSILSTMSSNYNRFRENSFTISNIVQGSTWKNITKENPNKMYIPYLLYQDDVEINNPLGSKRGVHKISAFYLSFPLLNIYQVSKLENILVGCLIKSSDIKHGSTSNYSSLITEIRTLEEEGININVDGNDINIHLVLAAFTGDNLGLNSVLGFSKSFSANYYCRICSAHKSVMQKSCVENTELFRNETNYMNHVSLNNVSETGVNEMCIFNQLPNFNVLNNVAVDCMHDLLEGICHVEVGKILNNLIFVKEYFSLPFLNTIKKSFNYGRTEKSNLTIDITSDNLKYNRFKMSASEMYSFLHYLPLLVGEFVPNKDPVWQFLLMLLELFDYVFKTEFSDSNISYLRKLIKKHHEEYLKLFKTKLTPKHHIITHYPTIIKKLGPLKALWTMRCEGKHKELKSYAKIITSRKNIALSIAKKLQFSFSQNCYKRINDETSIIRIGKCKLQNLSDIILENSYISNETLKSILSSNVLYLHALEYHINDIILLTEQSDPIKFFQIKYILQHSNNFFFAGNFIKIKCYNNHYSCYEIEIQTFDHVNDVLVVNENLSPPMNVLNLSDDKYVIKPKSIFL